MNLMPCRCVDLARLEVAFLPHIQAPQPPPPPTSRAHLRHQFVISGPEDTPYRWASPLQAPEAPFAPLTHVSPSLGSNGLFLFDAFFPNTYPTAPPKVGLGDYHPLPPTSPTSPLLPTMHHMPPR